MGLRGDRLKTIRELRGYTQEELAERMGVGTLQIYRWESGQNDPSGDSISRLAKVLDVTADYLLGLTDNIYKVVAEGDLSPMESKLIAAVRHGQIVEALEAMTALTKGTDQSNVTTVEPAIDR